MKSIISSNKRSKWVKKKGFSVKKPPGYEFNGKVPKRFRKNPDFHINLFQEFWEKNIKNDPESLKICDAIFLATSDLDKLIVKLKPKIEEFFKSYSEAEQRFLVIHVIVFDLIKLKKTFNIISKKKDTLTKKEFFNLFSKEQTALCLGLINYYLFKNLMLGTQEEREKIAYTWGIVEDVFFEKDKANV